APRRLVIFDLDGTLINTREAMQKAYDFACQAVALQAPPAFEEFVQHLGAPFPEILARMHLPPAMEPLFKDAAKKLIHLVSFETGMVAALRRFRKERYAIALFTGKDAERTQQALHHFSVTALFDFIVTGDDVGKGKPDPEGVIRLLRQTGVPASRAVYIGDSPYDILCAQRAGVKAVAVCWGMASRRTPLETNPTCLVDRQHDLFAKVAALLGEERITGDEPLSLTA